MSEVQKPVDEPVAAPTTETPAVEPVAESKPVEETPAPATETATETPAATEEAAPVKEEPKPIEEGSLGYKGPGLIKYVLFTSYPLLNSHHCSPAISACLNLFCQHGKFRLPHGLTSHDAAFIFDCRVPVAHFDGELSADS
jgi:hypothetical protein